MKQTFYAHMYIQFVAYLSYPPPKSTVRTPLWAEWHWAESPSEPPRRCRDVRPFRPRRSVYLQHWQSIKAFHKMTRKNSSVKPENQDLDVVLGISLGWRCSYDAPACLVLFWWMRDEPVSTQVGGLLFMRGGQCFQSTIPPTESLRRCFPRKSHMLMLRCTLTPATSQTKCRDHSAWSLLSTGIRYSSKSLAQDGEPCSGHPGIFMMPLDCDTTASTAAPFSTHYPQEEGPLGRWDLV